MKRTGIALLLALVGSASVHAQSVDFSKVQKTTKSDSIAKVVLENARYIATYDYQYTKDPAFPEDKRNGLTMLQVGKRYSRFMDYNEFRFDSLMDVTAKESKSYAETGPMMIGALRRSKFK